MANGFYDIVGAGDDDDMLEDLLRSGDGQLLMGDVDLVGANQYGRAGLQPAQIQRLKHVVAKIKQAATNETIQELRARRSTTSLGEMGVIDRPFSRANKVPAGFQIVLDAAGAGASGVISVQATVPFKPVRFSVPPQLATKFRLTSVNIGQKSYILGATPIPAACVLPDAIGDDWFIDTIQTSQVLFIGVQNTSGQALTVEGAVWGTMVT